MFGILKNFSGTPKRDGPKFGGLQVVSIEFNDLEAKHGGRDVHPLRMGRYEVVLNSGDSRKYRAVISKASFDNFIRKFEVEKLDPKRIGKITARSIYDAAGWPAIEVELTMDNGDLFHGSTDAYQRRGENMTDPSLLESSQLKTAHALVEAAISHINGELGPAIVNSGNLNRVTEQGIIDRFIVEKTNGKKWESHSLMALSMAVCKAGAAVKSLPLYEHIADLYSKETGANVVGGTSLPIPVFSMINVASKSSGDLSPVVQPAHEFLLFPNGARSFKQAMHMGVSVYHEVNKLIKSSGVGNDGGFSPYKLYSTDGLTFLLDEAIRRGGYGDGACSFLTTATLSKKQFKQGSEKFSGVPETSSPSPADRRKRRLLRDVKRRLIRECRLAVVILNQWDDLGSSADYRFGRQQRLIIQLLQTQTSVDDHLNHKNMKTGFKAKVSIKEDVEERVLQANSLLLMLCPTGTVSMVFRAVSLCHQHGWGVTFGDRPGGETTEETFLADLAVGVGSKKIKAGAPAREKASNYNRLLQIEEELGDRACYAMTE